MATGTIIRPTGLDVGTITMSSGTLLSEYDNSVKKVGSVVVLNFVAENVTISTSWSTIARITERFAPSKIVSGVALANNTAVQLRVIANRIDARASSSLSDQVLRFSISWIV